jgi:putative DNA primase/helicase
VADGRLHRTRAGKEKRADTWYVLHVDRPAAGAFGNWRTGAKGTWCEAHKARVSQADWDTIRRRWQDAEHERERVEAERHAKAAKIASWIVARAKPADVSHPYLARKRVGVHGDLRQRGDLLLVPLRDTAGELSSVQFIAPDKRFDGERDKDYLPGGRVSGCWYIVADRPDGPLAVCEGYATGASICEATGYATVSAMHCGNLLAVSKSLRQKFPQRDIVVAADNDQWTDGNPGVAKATEAAQTIHARLAAPQFKNTANRATDFNDLHQQEGLDAVKAQIQSATAPIDTSWPEPKPLPADLPPVPPFNPDWLPATLRPWVGDVAERMQCPPDFPAVGAMCALGSLVGRKIGIRPKRQDDWLVVPNLWGCIVGSPGVMKTPALEQALLPLRRLSVQALEEYKAKMQCYSASVMIQSQRKKVAEQKIAAFLKKGNENAARAAADSALSAGDDEPVLRRYEVNDSTVLKLGELLKQNPNGLLHHRDELVGLLRSLDKEGNEEARAFYLESWNGTGSFTFDRIGRGTVRIESITVSLIGGIQPDLLTGYVREAVRGGAGADGLLQRFQLAVWPDVSPTWQNVDRWPDTDAKNQAFAVFQHLDELTPQATGADTSDGIAFLRFAQDAQGRFDTWRATLELRLRGDTEHPAFVAHLSKYRKLVPALALLTHLANSDTGPVSRSALDKALFWAAYLEAQARRIYSAVLRPDTAAAREMAKHLRRGELGQQFTLREVYRKGWAGLSSKEDAEAATEILCDLGWIRPVSESGRTAGRPASPSFETNPKTLDLPRSQLTELTKPTSGSFVSAPHPVVENSTAQAQSALEPDAEEEAADAIRI